MAKLKKLSILKAAAAVIALIIPAAAAFAQTPDIRWYTKNPGAKKYRISTADELAGLAALVNNTAGVVPVDEKTGRREAVSFAGKTITLTKDIDLSKYCHGSEFNDGNGWIPIGHTINKGAGGLGYEARVYAVSADGNMYYVGPVGFRGTFDGNGKTISGLVSKNRVGVGGDFEERMRYNPGGLFGEVSGGTVKNLGVVNANVVGGGGIVGTLVGGGMGTPRGIVSNCYFTGTIVGDTANGWAALVGGIVGWMHGGAVSNCYFAGTATGKSIVGGIVGNTAGNGGSISNSYSTGTISGDYGVGGIVGSLNGRKSSVTNCYSTAAVSGKAGVGGIVGFVDNLEKTKVYSNISYEVMMMGFEDRALTEDTLYKVLERKLKGIKLFDTLDVSVSNNAALNSSVKATGSQEHIPLIALPTKRMIALGFERWRAPDSSFSAGGRVAGGSDGGHLSRNAAFSGISNNAGNAKWDNHGALSINGEGITATVIASDGTLGNRFTRKNGWTVQNGKLPGLFGTSADMPEHLK